MDVLAVPEGYVGRLYAVPVRLCHRVRDGVHIGDGVVMQEYIMTLIGIALVAMVVIIWA